MPLTILEHSLIFARRPEIAGVLSQTIFKFRFEFGPPRVEPVNLTLMLGKLRVRRRLVSRRGTCRSCFKIGERGFGDRDLFFHLFEFKLLFERNFACLAGSAAVCGRVRGRADFLRWPP